MSPRRLSDIAKRLFRETRDDDVSGLAAEFAFRFLLALFPFFIFVAALSGFVTDVFNVSDPTERIIDTIGDTLPEDAASVLSGQLESVTENQNPGLLSIGFLGALWASLSGMNAVIKGLNRVHDVKEQRPIWRRYLLAIGLTVLAGAAIIAAFLALVVGQAEGTDIAERIGFEGAFTTAFTILRWPVAVVLLLFAVAFLYWAAPNAELRFKLITPGSVLFTVGWLVATFAFSIYVANFGSYNSTYGTLGGVVILLIWLYISAFILFLGAQLNAVLEQERSERKEQASRPIAMAPSAFLPQQPEQKPLPEKGAGQTPQAPTSRGRPGKDQPCIRDDTYRPARVAEGETLGIIPS